MARKTLHAAVWALVRRQHGVITRGQLLALGFGPEAIQHRIEIGRLHPIHNGVYAVGRPELSRRGEWIAAVLACGEGAALSDDSAAALWEIRPDRRGPIHVTVPASRSVQRPGIVVHRRRSYNVRARHGVPATDPIDTLIDLAAVHDGRRVERAVNEAHNRDLVRWERLAAAVAACSPRRPGAAALRAILDRATFCLTDSELESLFLPIVRRAGLSKPRTRRRVHGFRADFWWPELGLVVETDGLRFHRTPLQQLGDRKRDQLWATKGITTLRFTHWQVAHAPTDVVRTLAAVAERLRGAADGQALGVR